MRYISTKPLLRTEREFKGVGCCKVDIQVAKIAHMGLNCYPQFSKKFGELLMIRKFEDMSPIVPDSCFIAHSTEIIGDVKLGENVSIWYGTMIRGDIQRIEIGCNTNIQDGSVLHVDHPGADPDAGALLIGSNVTVGHKALLHACKIGDNCLVGMGAIVLSGASIGNGCIIAAGAVVKENDSFPDNSLIVGIPARIKGTVSAEWHDKILKSSESYVELGRRHKASIA